MSAESRLQELGLTLPEVINGASDLLLEIFGEAGKHSRIALGAAALPLNAAAEISLVVEVE